MEKPTAKRLRVLRNTIDPKNEKLNTLVGKEIEVSYVNYHDNVVSFCLKQQKECGLTNLIRLDRSDIAKLTPLQFKGRYIAIGDKIEVWWKDFAWHTVYTYIWDNNYRGEGGWTLRAVEPGSFENEYITIAQDDILTHQLQEETRPTSTEIIAEIRANRN